MRGPGHGFAVVADEVRKLAERKMVATEDVASAEVLRDVLAHVGEAVDRTTMRVRAIASIAPLQALAAESTAQKVERIARLYEPVGRFPV